MKNTSCYTALILVFHCFVFTNLDKLEAYPDKALLLKQIRKKELMDAQLLKQSAQLLQELKKRDEKAGVRNGDLGKALIAYRSCKYLIETRSEKKKGPTRIDLKEKQNLSEPDFQSAILDLKAQMIKVLETEKIIERQKIHFPELFQKISELKNTNGRPLWIYIFSHVQLPKLAGEASGFNALTVMARAEGRFTSDTPSLRKLFPDLKKCNNGISVHIVFNQPGKVLSHEFGHILYLYHHWENYQKYIEDKGENYKFGGHSAGDPNGKAADLAENGKMPDLFSNKY